MSLCWPHQRKTQIIGEFRRRWTWPKNDPFRRCLRLQEVLWLSHWPRDHGDLQKRRKTDPSRPWLRRERRIDAGNGRTRPLFENDTNNQPKDLQKRQSHIVARFKRHAFRCELVSEWQRLESVEWVREDESKAKVQFTAAYASRWEKWIWNNGNSGKFQVNARRVQERVSRWTSSVERGLKRNYLAWHTLA